MEAINKGTSTIVMCLVCNSTLQCVPDADMVICPDCRVVSPVTVTSINDNDNGTNKHALHVGGVGLGLKLDNL